MGKSPGGKEGEKVGPIRTREVEKRRASRASTGESGGKNKRRAPSTNVKDSREEGCRPAERNTHQGPLGAPAPPLITGVTCRSGIHSGVYSCAACTRCQMVCLRHEAVSPNEIYTKQKCVMNSQTIISSSVTIFPRSFSHHQLGSQLVVTFTFKLVSSGRAKCCEIVITEI